MNEIDFTFALMKKDDKKSKAEPDMIFYTIIVIKFATEREDSEHMQYFTETRVGDNPVFQFLFPHAVCHGQAHGSD